MTYQIYNDGENLRFTGDGSVYYLVKQKIRQMALVREDIIRISTENCEKTIYFRRQDVTTPSSLDPQHLVDIIDTWIGGYVENPTR